MIRRLLSVACVTMLCLLTACGGGPEDGSGAAEWRGLAAEALENRAWLDDRQLEAKTLHARLQDLLKSLPTNHPQYPTIVDLYDRLTTAEELLAGVITLYEPVMERIWTGRGFPSIDSARKALGQAFAPGFEIGTEIDRIHQAVKDLRTS